MHFQTFAFNQAFTIHRETIPFICAYNCTLQTEPERVMKAKKSKTTTLVSALGCTLVAMASIVFTDEDWTALKVGGDLYFDVSGDTTSRLHRPDRKRRCLFRWLLGFC